VRGQRARPVFLLLLALAGSTAAWGAPPEIRVQLAPDPVALDGVAELTFTVATEGFRAPRVAPDFELEGLVATGGPYRSRSQSWVNGVASSRVQLVWQLRAQALGEARVVAIHVEVDGERFELDDLAVEVVDEAPARPAPGAPRAPTIGPPMDPFEDFFDEDFFAPFARRRPAAPAAAPQIELRSTLEPERAYVGQQVVWRLLLETQTDIAAFRPQKLPELAGFWARDLERPERPTPVWIDVGGERVARVAMLERALFPLRPGTFEIEAVSADVVARVASLDWFGRSRRDTPLVRTAPALRLEVRPVPPGPADFDGLVGELAVAARVEPATIELGRAATLVVEVTGTANLQGLTPPVPPLPDGLRVFPPETESADRTLRGRLQSTLRWRWVLIADRAGEFELPPVGFAYFDPVRGEHRRAASEPLALAVRAGNAPDAVLLPPDEEGAPTESEGARTGWPLAHRISGAGAGLAVFVALLALAVRALLGQLRRDDPRRALRRALEDARAEPAPRAAASVIDEAWRAYLAARFGLGRGVPVPQWPEALAAHGVGGETVADLVALFDELHLLEFAPELSDAAALRDDLFERSRRLLRRLR
jgi:hypothetical protein